MRCLLNTYHCMPRTFCACMLSLLVLSSSLWPIDCSPPGPSVHGIPQAGILEWVAISFSNAWKWKVKVKSLSPVWLLATPWTAAHQAPLSMGFSRQEYWSGVPLPSPAADLTSDNFIYKMGLTVYNLSISKRTNMNLSGDKKYTLDTFKTI